MALFVYSDFSIFGYTISAVIFIGTIYQCLAKKPFTTRRDSCIYVSKLLKIIKLCMFERAEPVFNSNESV
jgi:hypothetical protein